MTNASKINWGPIVSCNIDGSWLPDEIETKYELDFMDVLHSSKSYEEFKMKCDLDNVKQFDANYFGFNSIDEIDQWLKDYYNKNETFTLA